MPHLPRRPNSSGPAAEILAAMQKEQAAERPAAAKPKRRNSLALPTIDMNDWDVPVEKVFKHIFGKEPVRHEFTGELVPTRRADESPGGGQTHGPGTRR